MDWTAVCTPRQGEENTKTPRGVGASCVRGRCMIPHHSRLPSEDKDRHTSKLPSLARASLGMRNMQSRRHGLAAGGVRVLSTAVLY
jgi:hypothetical protein